MLHDIDKPPFFPNFIEKAVLVFIILAMLAVGYITFKEKLYDMKAHCDMKFGVGGWYLNETTGDGVCKDYVGQCWECVPNHPPEIEILG